MEFVLFFRNFDTYLPCEITNEFVTTNPKNLCIEICTKVIAVFQVWIWFIRLDLFRSLRATVVFSGTNVSIVQLDDPLQHYTKYNVNLQFCLRCTSNYELIVEKFEKKKTVIKSIYF